MRVLLLTNTRSGRGKAADLARTVSRALTNAGHEVELVEASRRPHSPEGTSAAELAEGVGGFARADVVVSIGGDGTIFHALPDLIRDRAPVYHVPGGNENLFAREFGMTREPQRLVSALTGGFDRERCETVDVGTVDGKPFVLMVSMGPDAGVIHRLDGLRTRAVGHAMYLQPTIEEGLRPHLARLTVTVDGKPLIESRRGHLLVANCGRYALGLDPARPADMRDGLLDVVFFPATTSVAAALWLARCVIGEPRDWSGALVAKGREILVTTEERAPWQTDGEADGWLEPGETLRLGVMPGALRVLRPAP